MKSTKFFFVFVNVVKITFTLTTGGSRGDSSDEEHNQIPTKDSRHYDDPHYFLIEAIHKLPHTNFMILCL